MGFSTKIGAWYFVGRVTGETLKYSINKISPVAEPYVNKLSNRTRPYISMTRNFMQKQPSNFRAASVALLMNGSVRESREDFTTAPHRPVAPKWVVERRAEV